MIIDQALFEVWLSNATKENNFFKMVKNEVLANWFCIYEAIHVDKKIASSFSKSIRNLIHMKTMQAINSAIIIYSYKTTWFLIEFDVLTYIKEEKSTVPYFL